MAADVIKIGDALYRFDSNRRVYSLDASGRAHGGPIYAEHFERGEVVGETKFSWLCRITYGEHKVNKKTMLEASPGWSPYRWYTEAQRDEALWDKRHRREIVARVEQCDAATLRRVQATLDAPSALPLDGEPNAP
jgi:hypothetical protein